MSRAQKQPERPRVVTTRTVVTMKESGEKIAMLTAYDFLMARRSTPSLAASCPVSTRVAISHQE